jgi:aryl-alcohol dehydrogenase-like predicted oxidoreductase
MTQITGYATPEATKAYADRMWAANPRLSPDGWRIFDGLTVAKIGTGTYRMAGQDDQTPAVVHALTHGLNLVDTAANYMGGEAESWLGQVLGAAMGQGAVSREELILVSKGGYIQGQDLASLHAAPLPETAVFSPQLHHCIHPDFLARQLAQSRARLGVATLDVFLLHNPEYQLQHKVQNGMPLDQARELFYDQITRAFTFLETACKEGLITRYGVSSNTLGMPAHYEDFVDLARLCACADAAAQTAWGRRKRSLFRVIQLPLNLLELGALREANTNQQTFEGPKPATTLELAAVRHMAVMVNRPLNALLPNGQMRRLADAPDDAGTRLAAAAEELTEVEHSLIQAADGVWPQDLPTIGYHWHDLTNQLNGAIHTDQVCQSYLRPQAAAVVDWIADARLKNTYASAYLHFEKCLKSWALSQEAEALSSLRAELHTRLPQNWHGLPLQQLALNALASTPGVTCVISGLRSPTYVAEALELMEKGDFPDAAQVLGAAA